MKIELDGYVACVDDQAKNLRDGDKTIKRLRKALGEAIHIMDGSPDVPQKAIDDARAALDNIKKEGAK